MTCTVCPVFGRPGEHEAEIGVACSACVGLVDADLVQLVKLVAALPGALDPMRSKAGGGGSFHQKPGSRLPVQLDALALLGPGSRSGSPGALPPGFLLREWATAWAILRRYTVEVPEYEVTADGRIWLAIVGVPDLAAYLRARLVWAADRLADFPRFAREVHACVRAVRLVTGEVTGEARPIGWCPQVVDDDGRFCHAPLSASTWDDAIDCASCSTTYPRSSWPELGRLMRDLSLTRR